MIKRNYIKYMTVIVALALWSCEPKVDEFTPAAGDADFSKFIAIGDSYTAGYSDGALGVRTQESGFSYILAKQLEHVGSGSYNQPLVESEGSIGTTVIDQNGTLNGYFELSTASGSLAPAPTVGDPAIFREQVYSTDNQNFGVPGAKSYHLLAEGFGNPAEGVGNYNPFYTRFMSSATASVISDAMSTSPSFVSLWIGGNDVLGYALAGGEGDAITSPAMFETYMGMLAAAAWGDGKGGVIANVPSINALPYFNTVPYNALPLDQATADLLNGAYAPYNSGVDMYNSSVPESERLPYIVFAEGYNALVIADADYPINGMRQILPEEKFLLSLPTSKIADEGWGTQVAIPAKYVLDAIELSAINDATAAYNATIKSISTQYNLAHVDLYSIMKEFSAMEENEEGEMEYVGVTIDGHEYSAEFVTGGVFSLDGVHATGRGSAVIANAFIEAINKEYDAKIPLAAINDYDMVEFP